MLDDLHEFIHSNPDARELKRAIAVQMFLKGYKHREIGESLGSVPASLANGRGVTNSLEYLG